jgi:hypothetical protein
LEALIAGQTMPQALAALAHWRIHASAEKLEAAQDHRFLLEMHLDQIDATISERWSSDM